MGAPDQGRYPALEVNDRGCPGKPDHLRLGRELEGLQEEAASRARPFADADLYNADGLPA